MLMMSENGGGFSATGCNGNFSSFFFFLVME